MNPRLLLLPALIACTAAAAPPSQPPRFVYYLHGKIVEDSGPTGVSPRFGAYDYPGILAAFRRARLTVVSEIRPKDTDPSVYADKIVADVRAQLASGVPASRITIVGASKGSVIAMLVSTRLKEDRVRYVFLANCNDWMERTWHPRFSGEVLSIYESSDDTGHSCRPIARRSPKLKLFREIGLSTGLGHGLIYRSLMSWVGPAIRWARRPAGRAR